MVAYNPGGATDFQARLVTMMAAHPKKDYLGQPIVIVNKPGAGGKVGWNWFASKARTDGYDLAAYNIPHFVSQSIVFDDTKYNIDNLEPIANWGADPAVLIVGKDSQFNSVADLSAGKITEDDYAAAEISMSRSKGNCMTMGTASTMGSMVEALGMSLPHNAAIPAVDARLASTKG